MDLYTAQLEVPVWNRKVADQTLSVNAGAQRAFLPTAGTGVTFAVFSVIGSQGGLDPEKLYITHVQGYGTGQHGVQVGGGTDMAIEFAFRISPDELVVWDLNVNNPNGAACVCGVTYFASQ